MMAKQRVRYMVKAKAPVDTPIARMMAQPFRPQPPKEMNPPQTGALVGRLCYHQATEQYLKALRDFHTGPKGKTLLGAAGLEPVLFGDIGVQQWDKARRFAAKVSSADRVRSEAKRLSGGSKGWRIYHNAGLAKTANLMASHSWAQTRGTATTGWRECGWGPGTPPARHGPSLLTSREITGDAHLAARGKTPSLTSWATVNSTGRSARSNSSPVGSRTTCRG